MSSSLSTRRPLAALAGALILTGHALAGGGGGSGSEFQSVQAGSWTDPAVWDLAAVPFYVTNDLVDLDHDVVVADPGAGALSTVVGANSGGSLRILPGGTYTADFTILGLNTGVSMTVEGGTCQPGQLRVGNQFHPVDFELSGGALAMDQLWIAGQPGILESPVSTFRVVGGAATASVSADTYVGANGTIEFRPTTNGAAGLTMIAVDDVHFEPGSALRIDPTYPAQPGDSWEVLGIGGSMTGAPALEVVGPYVMAISPTPFGTLEVTVTGDVVPGDLCVSPVIVPVGPQPAAVLDADLSLTTPIAGGPTCVTGSAVADLWFRLDNDGVAASATAEIVGPSTQVALEVYDFCGGNLLACGGSSGVPGAAAVTFAMETQGSVLLRVSSPIAQDVDVAVAFDGGWTELFGGTSTSGVVELEGTGVLIEGEDAGLFLQSSLASVPVLGWLSLSSSPFPALGGTVYAFPYVNQFLFMTDALGDVEVSTTWPAGLPAGTDFWIQFICTDGSVPGGLVLSSALRGTTPVGSFP